MNMKIIYEFIYPIKVHLTIHTPSGKANVNAETVAQFSFIFYICLCVPPCHRRLAAPEIKFVRSSRWMGSKWPCCWHALNPQETNKDQVRGAADIGNALCGFVEREIQPNTN